MELDAPPAALYDFLYRDSNRISSYYAQLFGGKLASLEHTQTTSDGVERSAGVSVTVAKGDVKNIEGTQTSARRVFDPHDLVTSDVLSLLTNSGRVNRDPRGAGHGELVLAKGAIVFVDRIMVDLVSATLSEQIKAESQKPAKLRTVRNTSAIKAAVSMLSNMAIPSTFLMETTAGTQIAGTIKDAGMEEPISSYYVKQGSSALPDVFLIGLKETPVEFPAVQPNGLFDVSKEASQALNTLLFPVNTIRVVPIALFREIL